MSDSKNYVLNSSFLDFDLYVPSGATFQDLNLIMPDSFAGVIIITQIPENNDQNSEVLKQLLAKICQSVGLKLGSDTLLLNIMPGKQIQFTELNKNIEIKRLIVFGPTPSDLGMHLSINLYQIIKWNGKELLFVDSLKKIQENIDKKKLLWSLLKQLFLT